MNETNTTGAKNITFNNNKGLSTALLVLGGGVLVLLVVREITRGRK